MGASHMEELGIVIRADGTVELANGMKLSADQISAVGKKLDEHGQSLQKTEKAQKAVTTSAKEMGSAMGQTADQAVQLGKDLANGQWKNVAGDLAQAAIQSRVLTGAMVAGAAVVGTIAAGLGAIAYAAYEGAKAEKALNDQLTLTGNFADLVTGQLDGMASSVARAINGNVGKSREVLAGLVATGRFTADSLAEAGAAAQLLQRYTGETTEQVVQRYAQMGDGVAKWAQKANDSYHFLSIEQFKHIKLLEDQNRKQDAMRETSEALSRHLGGDLTANLGTLQRAWIGVQNWAAQAWDAMMGIGRAETAEDKIKNITTRIETIRNSNKGRYTQEQKDQLVSMLEGERSVLQSDSRQDRRLATNRSTRQQADDAAIDELMKRQKKPAAEDNAAENYLAQLEKQLRGLSGESSAYADVLEHLKVNVDKFTLSQGYAALAIAESIDKQKAKKTVDAAELQYLKEISTAREQATNVWLDQQATMRQELRDREFEISLLGKTAEQVARLTAARQVEQSVSARRSVVLGDRDAGRISDSEMIARLKALDENAAAQMVQRNFMLADQFKPGWQKMIEGWGDSMQMMRDAHSEAMGGIVKTGEDTWVQFARTGKLNVHSMVDGVIAEMARLQYRQYIAKPFANFMNGILGNLFGGGDGGGAATGGSDFAGAGEIGNMGADFIVGGMHSGGIAGRAPTFNRAMNPKAFANAPRFHTGGIAGDEVPIIARKKEGIFTEEQMAALSPAGSGLQVTYAPQIHIDARTDRAEVEKLVGNAMLASQADLMEKINRKMM